MAVRPQILVRQERPTPTQIINPAPLAVCYVGEQYDLINVKTAIVPQNGQVNVIKYNSDGQSFITSGEKIRLRIRTSSNEFYELRSTPRVLLPREGSLIGIYKVSNVSGTTATLEAGYEAKPDYTGKVVMYFNNSYYGKLTLSRSQNITLSVQGTFPSGFSSNSIIVLYVGIVFVTSGTEITSIDTGLTINARELHGAKVQFYSGNAWSNEFTLTYNEVTGRLNASSNLPADYTLVYIYYPQQVAWDNEYVKIVFPLYYISGGSAKVLPDSNQNNSIDVEGQIFVYSNANTNELIEVTPTSNFGPVDPQNPVGFAVSLTTTSSYVIKVAYDPVSNGFKWSEAIEVLKNVNPYLAPFPYYIIPLTTDDGIQTMFASAVQYNSSPERKREMITIYAKDDYPVVVAINDVIVFDSNDFNAQNGLYKPSKYRDANGNVVPYTNFLDSGGRTGHYVELKLSNNVTYYARITGVTPDGYSLSPNIAPIGNAATSATVRIVSVARNKSEIATNLSLLGSLVNSYRVKILLGTSVDLNVNGRYYQNVSPMYLAAAYAVTHALLGVSTPMTNKLINNVVFVRGTNGYFTDDQIDVILNGNIDVIANVPGGGAYSVIQVMTDGSELSEVVAVDYSAKFIRDALRGYLGQIITPQLLNAIRGTVSLISDRLRFTNVIQNLTIVSGPTVRPEDPRSIELRLNITTFKAFNHGYVTIIVS